VSRTAVSYRVRPYTDDDERAVLDLLELSLGGGPAGSRSPGFFRWKHGSNPFGRSFMLVAETEDGRVIGLRAFLRWRFRAGDATFQAVRAVDTATHPEFRGAGVFSRLTREAVDALRGQIDLVFNTPNQQSGPGYLKLGWRTVGRLPVAVRVRRPLRFLRGIRGLREPGAGPGDGLPVAAPPAAEILGGDQVAGLLAETRRPEGFLHTDADAGYLRWRYGRDSGLGYRAVSDVRAGRLRGVAVFRVRPRGTLWESSVADLIVPGDDVGEARRLLGMVRRAASVDHLTGLFPAGSPAARAAGRQGFLPVRSGPNLVVNPLREGLRPDPSDRRSWGLVLGDVEVF
jgi:GNAT superfamily N-acetyltransferase